MEVVLLPNKLPWERVDATPLLESWWLGELQGQARHDQILACVQLSWVPSSISFLSRLLKKETKRTIHEPTQNKH
jgi:hypothetical protein